MVLLPLLGAAAVTAAALALGLRHVHDVRSSPSPTAPKLVAELRKTPPAERIALAARRTEGQSWEGRLARALCASEDASERADAASEAVGDLALLYGSRARWAPAALRIQILGAVLMAAWAMALGEGLPAVLIATVAFAGAMATHALGRRVKEHERDQRERADSLVMLLMSSEGSTPRVLPRESARAGRRTAEQALAAGRRRR